MNCGRQPEKDIGRSSVLSSHNESLIRWTTDEKEKEIEKRNRSPKGWNEARVRDVLEHYENQTENEAVAEDEAAFRSRDQTVMVGSEPGAVATGFFP